MLYSLPVASRYQFTRSGAQRSKEAMPSKREVADLYRKRARNNDFAVRLYNLLGFRIDSYRQEAVESLHLKPGNTVVDIACGTGANFPMLQERIGQSGKIIGVDFAD